MTYSILNSLMLMLLSEAKNPKVNILYHVNQRSSIDPDVNLPCPQTPQASLMEGASH